MDYLQDRSIFDKMFWNGNQLTSTHDWTYALVECYNNIFVNQVKNVEVVTF